MKPRSRSTTATCRVCGEHFDLRRYNDAGEAVGIYRGVRTCLRHRWARTREVLVDRITPYTDDVAAQLFVNAFPMGATLEMVGDAMGVSRERVRQLESVAFEKLREAGCPLPPIYSEARHDAFGGGDEDSEAASDKQHYIECDLDEDCSASS